MKKIVTTLPKALDREQINEAHKNLVSTYPYGHLVPGRDGLDFVIEVPDEPNEDKKSQSEYLPFIPVFLTFPKLAQQRGRLLGLE